MYFLEVHWFYAPLWSGSVSHSFEWKNCSVETEHFTGKKCHHSHFKIVTLRCVKVNKCFSYLGSLKELNWVTWDWEVQSLFLDIFSLSTFLLPPPCFSWCCPEYKWRLMLFLEQGCLHAISPFQNDRLVLPSGCASSHIHLVASLKYQNTLDLPRTNSWELSVTSPWRLDALQVYNPWSDRETFAINSKLLCRWWVEDSLTLFLNQVTFASGTPGKTLVKCN